MAVNPLISLGVEGTKIGDIVQEGRLRRDKREQQTAQNNLTNLRVQNSIRSTNIQEENLRLKKDASDRQARQDTIALIERQTKNTKQAMNSAVVELDILAQNGQFSEIKRISDARVIDLLPQLETNPSVAKQIDLYRVTSKLAETDPKQAKQVLSQFAEKFERLNRIKPAATDSESSNIAKVSPSKFTPESLQKFSQSADFSDLVAVEVGKPSENEKQTNALIARGVPKDRAFDIANGLEKIDVSPQTGRVTLTNVATGEVKELPKTTGQPDQSENLTPDDIRAAATAEQSPADIDPAQVFGFVPRLKEIGSQTLGVFFGSFEEPEVRSMRSQGRLIREEIINALAKSGRPPVVEQARILEAFPSFGFFESVGGAVGSLKGISKMLSTVREDDAQFFNDPNNPDKLRQEARERVRRIDRVLTQIKPLTDLGIKSVQDINGMTNPEITNFIASSTDQELENMPPDVKEAIKTRFK